MVFPLILTILTGLVALVWASRHLMLNHERRHARVLSPQSPGPEGEPPMLSVIVSAKDEQDNIEPCIRSMMTQDYPNFEFIVVNDRSEDATEAICRRLQEEGLDFRLVNVEELPEGWCGKNHGIHVGVQHARGDYLCMIDADCRQASTRTLSVAMGLALREGIDMLSILPALEMKETWETIVQPVCSGVLMIWCHPDKVNDPRRPHVYANGAFYLFRREAYEGIGGHAAIAGRIQEDLGLARLVKSSGRKLHVARSDGLYWLRMYDNFRDMLRGWIRIFHGVFDSSRRLIAAAAVLVVMGWLPWASAVLGWAMWSAGGTWWWLAPAIAGSAGAAMQMSVIFRFQRLLKGRAWLAWSYPLGAGIAIYAVFRALLKRRRGATLTYRGTTYQPANAGR